MNIINKVIIKTTSLIIMNKIKLMMFRNGVMIMMRKRNSTTIGINNNRKVKVIKTIQILIRMSGDTPMNRHK